MTQIAMKRRHALQALFAATTAGVASSFVPRRSAAAVEGPRFLIVLPAFGGGAIIDSFLPVGRSESATPEVLDVFEDSEVTTIAGSPIRAADPLLKSFFGFDISQNPLAMPTSWFAEKYKQWMMIAAITGTSVNHAVAQKRALSGGGIWAGRTMQEIVALTHGEGFPLPNVNMASLGYLERGSDPSLPASAYAEPIPNALLKPLSFSGHRGLLDTPSPSNIDLARALRNEQLDPKSEFYQAFYRAKKLELWRQQREISQTLEDSELIDRLIFFKDSAQIPLNQFGLQEAPEADALAQLFPDLLSDPLEQQAALACLLIKNKISVSVTLAPGFAPVNGGPFGIKNPPLAFDASHNDHRFAQAFMWNRVLSVADKMITFLQSEVYDGSTGETFWDRSMIHFATDFGREKRRPNEAARWGTGHDVNNGHLTVSPLVNGNTVLGGVDPDTCMTYGFDLQSGAVLAPGQNVSEGQTFGGLLQALGVNTTPAGLDDVPAMRAD